MQTTQQQPKPAQVLRFRKPRRKPARQQGDFLRRRAEVELRNRMAL